MFTHRILYFKEAIKISMNYLRRLWRGTHRGKREKKRLNSCRICSDRSNSIILGIGDLDTLCRIREYLSHNLWPYFSAAVSMSLKTPPKILFCYLLCLFVINQKICFSWYCSSFSCLLQEFQLTKTSRKLAFLAVSNKINIEIRRLSSINRKKMKITDR